MKDTAEEILSTVPEWNYGQYKTTDVIKAMKLYANSKLDEAAENAKTILAKGRSGGGMIVVNKESILSFKDEI